MWVEFVVGSLLGSESFFSGYSGFSLSSKSNIAKFQFVLDYCQALYDEPLARVIAKALPVLDVKFTFTFTNIRIHTNNTNAFLIKEALTISLASTFHVSKHVPGSV